MRIKCKRGRFASARLLLSFYAVFSVTGHAEVINEIEPFIVTASRIPEAPNAVPYAIQTITLEDISKSGVRTVNEALRVLGGIQGSINTSGGRDQVLDMRGFGEESASNQVILVDGVRQNEGDKTGVDLGWITINSVDRIEILRGSGSVMYGEGASAGVINVITKKDVDETDDKVLLAGGSNGTRELRLSKFLPSGNWRTLVTMNRYLTDNHRENYAYQGSSLRLNSHWADDATTLSIGFAADESRMGLPGGLNVSDALSRPSFSYKPNDRGSSTLGSLTLAADTVLGAGWHGAVDVSRRLRSTDAVYVLDDQTVSNLNSMSRIGVRSWWDINTFGLKSVFVVGVDQERWGEARRSVYSSGPSHQNIDQTSDAVYFRQSTMLSPQASAFWGARRTLSDRVSSGSTVGALKARNNSWEAGGTLALSQNEKFFLRLGQGVRLAKADEFATCYPDYGSCSDTVNKLKPQTSKDAEVGFEQRSEHSSHEVRIYQSRIRDEIGLDADKGFGYEVANFSPTIREGLEYTFSSDLSKAWTVGGAIAVRSAKFKGEPLNGNEVPLVSRYFGTANLRYNIDGRSSLMFVSQIQSSQVVSGDIRNACSDRLPGFGIATLKYTQQREKYTWRAEMNNVFDRSYYNFRSRCDATKKSVYPEAGRTILVALERAF